MNINYLRHFAVASLSICAATSAFAAQQPPHGVKGSSQYGIVKLQWQSPATDMVMRWHDNTEYNGDNPISLDKQKPAVTWFGAKFTAADIEQYVGKSIKAVQYYQYRPVHKVEVSVLRDGEVVATGIDNSSFEKGTFRNVPVPAVKVESGHEYMMVVKMTGGYNQDFIGIKDRATECSGKSDLMSHDGKNWIATNNGDYLIGALCEYENAEAPTAYKVYCDGTAVEGTLGASALACTVDGQTAGEHTYQVAAVYADGSEKLSHAVKLNITSFKGSVPSVTMNAPVVDGLDVNLAWTAPLGGGSKLGWCTDTMGNKIGGTATTNTKLWIRNQFDAQDLPAFAGGKLTAINCYFAEATVTDVTLWVMCNGSFIYNQKVSAEAIAAIKAGEWARFTLDTPVQFEDGNSYDYGIYLLQTPKTKPIAVDNTAGVDVKGNQFSTSTPNSTSFVNSKPTWKTLASGNIKGSWMMTADIEGAPAAVSGFTYDVARNGVTIASALSQPAYTDQVPAPGKYTYSVSARLAGVENPSFAKNVSATVALPAEYTAPQFEAVDFNEETKKFSLSWNMDKLLSHYGTPAYTAGFNEELTMIWGSQFSAAELAPLAGMEIKKLKILIGDAIGDFKAGVYTSKGTALGEISLKASDIEPLYTYTVELPQPVAITGEEDLIIAYNGTIPSGKSGLVLDQGPLANGGARVSFTGGATWMNLGTVATDYNKYNIVIAGLAAEPNSTRTAILGNDFSSAELSQLPVAAAEREFGIMATETAAMPVSKVGTRASARPKAASYNVYCNGSLLTNTAASSYSEDIKRFTEYDYYVTAVYENGWESPESRHITFANTVAQKSVAPYGFNASVAGGKATFSWIAASDAPKLSYVTDATSVLGLGMTTANPTSHAITRYKVADLAPYVGKKVDHIQFVLADAVNSAAVIVTYGENIVYRQEIDAEIPAGKLFDVRLNEPVEIPADTEVGVGYIVQYNTGVKPMGMTAGPAVPSYGDIITSSAASGTWYSLKTKFSMDNNWYINAILADADQKVERIQRQDDAVSYNIYRDGTCIASGIKGLSYTDDATAGAYQVAAVTDGVESALSNAVVISRTSGVDAIGADTEAGQLLNLQGLPVDRATAAPGVYLLRRNGSTEKVVIR